MKRLFQHTYDQIKSNSSDVSPTKGVSSEEPDAKRSRTDKGTKSTTTPKLSLEDIPYSSDEDNSIDAQNLSASTYCLFSFGDTVTPYLASPPKITWPVPLNVSRKVKVLPKVMEIPRR